MSENASRRTEERAKAASYIAELTVELAQIAREHGFHTLGYLLDMAKLEADNMQSADRSIQ